MSAQTHTPLPWIVERHDEDDGSISYEIWHTATKEGYDRVTTINDQNDSEMAKGNAEFIVSAVNGSNQWVCKAPGSSPEPTNCNWPFCGCDPYANKLLEHFDECGLTLVRKDHT